MADSDRIVITRGLLTQALTVALQAPLRQGKYTYAAGVPWRTVHALRAELEANGIDWRAVHPQSKKQRPSDAAVAMIASKKK